MELDLQHFKTKLEEEQKKLEQELKTVGRVNPSNPEDWEPTPEKMNVMRADKNEVADTMEEYEENTAILRELEIRLGHIKNALKKIESGTYGICEVGGEVISKERLEVNPSATTCVAHANDNVNR
jgi:RNA polymerase-binding transcription factor DksA